MQESFIYRQFKGHVPVSFVEEKIVVTIFILGLLCLSSLSCSLHKDWQPVELDIASDTTVLKSTDAKLPAAIKPLISQADRFMDHRKWSKAISILERALRINKRQAETWTRMAIAYQGKNELEQAIQMARRSNSYAAQNTDLKVYNWQLISNAYLQLNKLEQAQLAAQKSQQLQDNH